MNGVLFDIITDIDVQRGLNGSGTITSISWMLVFGIVISWFFIYYHKKVIGDFINALFDAGADSEENAKTLAEIGQERNVSAINKYSKSVTLQKLVICDATDADPKNGRLKIDENTKFYIEEQHRDRLKSMYNPKGNSMIFMLIGAIVLAIFAVIVGFAT